MVTEVQAALIPNLNVFLVSCTVNQGYVIALGTYTYLCRKVVALK